LSDELRASGFDVLKSEPPSGSNVLKINGELSTFFVEPVIGFWSLTHEADIGAKLIATTDTGLLAERSFFVKGTKKAMVSTMNPLRDAVKRAADQIITDMVEAIFYLMDKYPQISSRNSFPTAAVPALLEGK
jgi:hypothetical protein